MTLQQFFDNTTAEERSLWMGKYAMEAEEQSLRELAARAEASRRNRR